MNKNIKRIFLFTTVLMLLATVTALSAADTNDNSTAVSSDIQQVSHDTSTVEKTVQTYDNKNTIEQSQKAIKKDGTTHVVNNDNVDEIFSGEGYGLADSISEGDTLDFQGLIDKNHSLVINKPINTKSSTNDAFISLHTVAGSLMGEDPGNSFVVNIGASGSNITGLYLNNTECWVHNVYNAVLYNMTMHVENARVGSGVGQTSLRYCNNVTMDSCTIYTENNGGSSSFVWTGCNNCTIVNSTVQGEGNVGNLLYVGNGFNTQDKPANYTITNFDNNVINCTIIGGTGGISNPLQNMATRTYIEGNKFYAGGSASSGTNGTFINNEFYRTVTVSMSANTVATGNVHYGNGTVSIAANSTVENNTFYNATISGAGVTFEGNTVLSRLNVNQPTNVTNNNLNNVNINTNGKVSNITNNNITGTVTSAAANVTIDSNNITTTNDYAVVVTGATNTVTNNILLTSTKAGDDTLNVKTDTTVDANTPEAGAKFVVTDETYANFFNTDGLLSNENVTNYSALTFQGSFNDKVFIFDNVILSINSDNAVINNGYIETTNNAVVAIEGVTFNNTKAGIENSIILNTNGNLIRNNKIYRTSDNGISREIMVNGDKNIITSNTFDLKVPVENIDYSEYPFAISNASAITTTGSFNTITSNTINVANTTDGFGTISVIDLASKTKSSNNTVTNNIITATSAGYLYGINLGANTDCNTINSNNIILNSGYYTAGIQIGYSPAYNNTINSNNINLTSSISYGILASAYGGEVTGTTINSNNINITANELAGIELCGSTPDTIHDSVLTSNKIIADGNYTIGIGISGSNIQLITNNVTVKGTTNTTDDLSYDIIKPTTAGIIIQNSNNVIGTNNTIDVENGANYILNGTTNAKIASTTTVASRFINTINNANIVLINSDNNIIDTQKSFTTGTYAIELTNSSNNNITNNNLNASNINGGNAAVLMDEASQNNYLNNNTPVFGLLTDDTYDTLFDENGVYTFPTGVDILTLAGDLHNKDLIFTNNLTFTNGGNYTIYNGSIILNDVEGKSYTDRFVNIKNININNTDKSALIDNLSVYRQRNVQIMGGVFAVNGDNVTAFESESNISLYTILDVSNATVIMDGTDITAFKMTRDVYSRNDYLDIRDCNITLKSTGKNTAFEVFNTNLDILRNNIVQEGNEAVTFTASNVYANSQFFMNNNITVTADNANNLITLKDNQGSNPSFGNNTITVTSSNPVCVFNVTNAGKVYIGQGQYSYASYNTPNTIIVNADNGEVPVVYVDSTGYVRNNFIMANDLYGNEAVEAATVSNNIPFETNVVITAPESVKTGEEVTVSAKVTNKTGAAVAGSLVMKIDGEIVAESDSSSISYTFTIENANTTVTVEYTNTSTIYVASSNQTSLLNTKATIVEVDDIQAVAGENLTVSATFKDVYGNDINGGKAILKINGVTLKDENGKVIYVKVVDGVAQFENIEIPEKWAGKTLDIQVVYSGTSKYDSMRVNTTVTVESQETGMEFTTKDITAHRKDTITLSVKVNAQDGKVVFKVNGKTVKDANGKVVYAKVVDGIATVEYTVPNNFKYQTYNVTAAYLYKDERLEANTTLTIEE